MTEVGSVRTTVVVDLAPGEAFEVFTAEMTTWYRRGAASLGHPEREAALRLEPHVGGRVLRVGQGEIDTEIGRVTGWEPGRRLRFVDHLETEIEVWFKPDGPSTRVVLEHRGLDRLPADVAAALAQYGWRRMPLWFEDYVKERTP